MEEKPVIVLNEMAEYLNVGQMKKLQEVLFKAFAENAPERKQVENSEFLRMFLDAKKIEGCADRTIRYYKSTVEGLLRDVAAPLRRITTEEIRKYLVDYQNRGGCGKSTLDNIRRNLSSFFSWMEEENYILKSPMRRIHTALRRSTRSKQAESFTGLRSCTKAKTAVVFIPTRHRRMVIWPIQSPN